MQDNPPYPPQSQPTAPATASTPNKWQPFLDRFPTSEEAYRWFAPIHWERFAGTPTAALVSRPCPTLRDLATLYHADHSAHARQWMELGVPIRALPDVVSRRGLYSPLTTPFSFGRWFRAGRFRVLPFPLVHYDPDGTPCPTAGFLIDHPGTGRVLFATDTAALAREEMTDDGLRLTPYHFTGVATWLIEANYDDYILHLSDLPKAQKDRIRQSHLSVSGTVATLRAADLSRTRHIVLLHLSDRNSVNNEQKIVRRVRLATGKRCCIARPGLTLEL